MTMSSLQAMNERMNQWMAEKPTFDGGNELRLNRDDLAIFQFVSSGNDGDQFIKVYRSHIVQAISKKGKPYNTHRYCPVQSGDDVPCPLCDQGVKDIKERMSIWMYVMDIMHTQLPQEKQFPMVLYEGKNYYREEVNGWRIWNTSAWRDSCWPDIIKLGNIYSGLQNFTAQLICTGDGLNRRYKVFALPNSAALTTEMYARAKEECESIPLILNKQINSPVENNPQQANPQDQGTPWAPQGTPYMPPQQAAPYSPGQPAVSTPAQPPQNAPSVPGQPTPVDPPPSAPEADVRRPLKSLF
jgi:hypothetical protein